MPPLILMAYSMGIPNEKRPDLIFDTEVDHLSGRLMPLVTNTPLGTLTHSVLGSLRSLPSTRILLASGLPFSKLSNLLGALMFEGTDPTSGHNERLGGRGSHGRQMDFAKIDGGLNFPWGRFRLWDFYASLVNSKPRFQTNVAAQLLEGRSMGSTRDVRPLPIGSTTRPFSLLTA